MEDNQKLKALHESLLKDNYELPSYEVFAEDLRSPEKSKAFYEGLVKDNYELPDYEVFVNDLGLKKKDYFFGRDLVKELYGEESAPESKEPAPEVSKKPSPSELANFKFTEPKDAVKKAFQSSLPEPADLTTPNLSLKKTDGKFSFPNNDINDSLARAMLDVPVKEDKPEAKPIDYVTALPQGFNQRMGQAIRNIGAVVNAPKEALAKGVQKIVGKAGSANEQYLRQAFSSIPGFGYFDQETMDQLATAVETAGNPGAIPNDIIGKTLGSTGSILFDVMSVRTAPLPKLNALAKYGMERVPMFPSYLAVMEGTTKAREGGTVGETVMATTEGAASGLTYEGMGIAGNRVGQLVKELGGGQTLSTTSRALANSALFGADSKAKGGSFMEGAAVGFVFGGYDLATEGINRSMAHRAYVSYLTATDNNIKTISKMQVDPMKLRKQSDDLWNQYEQEKDPAVKKVLLEEKTEVDNIININAMTQEILKNPKAFTDAIAKDERLSPKEKALWTNKINTTVKDADPRLAEAEPIVADIKQKEGELAYWQENEIVDPMIKDAKVESVTTQIEEQNKALQNTLAKPLDDYAPKKEKGKTAEKKAEGDAESKLAIGEKQFKTKDELNTYLEDIAVNKKTGEVDETWFDREINAWPTPETVKAINEWTENKKAEIKAKKKPVKEEPIEAGLTKVEQKELTKNDLIDEVRRFNILSASGKKKAAMQANTIRVNAKRLGYELKEGDEWKVGVVKDGKFLAIRKDPTKVDKAKLESQQLLSEKDQDFQDYVKDVFETNPDLYGVMIGGLTNEQRAQAFRDIQAGRKTTASAQALNELERMYKDSGGIDIWNAEGKMRVGISREEIRAEIEDMKRRKRDELFSTYNLDEALNKGLLTKTEYDEIRESERKQDIESRAAEEDFYRSEAGDIEGGKEKGTEGELTPEINEQPVKQPDITTGKTEGDQLQGGTEKGVAGVEGQGTKEPAKQYTPEQQRQVDAINAEYSAQIAEVEKSIITNKKAKDKAVAEAQGRQGLFGDTKDTGEAKMFSQEEQGFGLTQERLKAIEQPYRERESELNKQLDNLRKEKKSKIGEVEKQLTIEVSEPAKVEVSQGIKFKDKNYTDIEQVQDGLAEGKITFDESKKLMEDVRTFEDNLKAEASKKAASIGEKMNKNISKAEDELNKSVDDQSKLFVRLVPPDVISQGNTALWKQLVKVRDGVSNWIAGKLQEGMASQTDAARWTSKAITNWYGGLGRTQRDIMGKLKMTGTVKEFAPLEAGEIRDRLLKVVNSDPESLRRVRDALDPEIATEQLVYGDLTPSEKNLYFQLRDLNTWVHETNYANGFIPTDTYLKFKDVTGDSKYIARLYDQYEIMPEEISEFIKQGNNSVQTKIVADIFKARSEVDEWKKEHAITDPTYLTAKRVMQTIQNTAVKEYMDQVIADHPDLVRKVKKGEAVPAGFTKLSSSFKWGPFRNRAVANHIVEDFTGFFFANEVMNVTYDAMKMFDRTGLNQFYKKFRTVYNPFVQLGNMTGNLFFSSIAGVNPATLTSKMPSAIRDMNAKTAEYKSLLKSGVLGNVGITADMSPVLVKEATPNAGTVQADTWLDKARGLFEKADQGATKLYQGADNVAKYAAYKIFREQGLSHEQSVRRVYDAYQNYSTVGKTWDVASKTPFLGNKFVKFQADLQRILLNSVTTSPLTTAGTLALISVAAKMVSALSGETEEEQKIRESRKGVAKIPLPFGMSVPLSFKIGKSEVNMARYLAPLYIYKYEDSDADLAELSKFMPFQVQKVDRPALNESGYVPAFSDPTYGFIASIIADRDFRGISIQNPKASKYHNPNPTTDERIANVMNYVGRTQIPFYRSAQDLYDGITGNLDYYGRKRDWKQAILNNLIKIQEFDKPEVKSYVERNIDYLTNRFVSLSARMGDSNAAFFKAIKEAQDKNLPPEVIARIYESQDKVRAKRLQKSLDEQVSVMQELERMTGVYKKWFPDDPFIEENFMNIQQGKNQRFNVMDDIDLQKKYKDEYGLLKSNKLLKRPSVPSYLNGVQLTEEQRKDYLNTYWSEYIRQLDMMVGLTAEEFEDEKKLIIMEEPSETTPMPKKTSLLDAKASSAAETAKAIAEMQLRMNQNK